MGRVYRARLSAGSRLVVCGVLLAVGLATTGTVHAADLPVPGPAYYPQSFPPPAIYDWTGIYLGGHVGGGILTDSVSQNGISNTATNLFSSGQLRPAGVIGGAQLGANYEFVPWVVGIEGSWTDSGIQGNTLIGITSTSITTFPVPNYERFTSDVLWFASLTGRAGYAANDWLFYAKAGGAWMHVSYTEDLLSSPFFAGSQVISGNRTGFTVGAGIEFGFTENISGKIEYDFYDFGSKNYNFFAITPVSVRSDLHTLIVGLNYKFNWSGGPKP
jgi:outer membrane immunogenic protein